MSAPFTVMLVHAAPDWVARVQPVLGREPGVQVLPAKNAAEAERSSATEAPGLIVAWAEPEVGRTLALCGSDAGPGPPPVVLVVAAPGDEAARLRALRETATALLPRAPEPEELIAWLGVARRLRQEGERRRADAAELERLREAMSQCEERIFALLVGVVDLALPGAVDRGVRVAALARKLAARFGIPEGLLRDMDLAARLHELGRVVSAAGMMKAPSPLQESEGWQYTQSTVAILKQTGELEGVCELITGLYENWDGTGHPGHWQQGQIPLRCRILRALIDFFAALDRPGGADPEEVLEELGEHAGTRYDPMVLVHLKAVVIGSTDRQWLGQSVLLPITELREGMVLAEDLYTDAGLKLLARHTTLTPATLEIILRRHRSEPILQGAAVLRMRKSA